MNHWYIQSWFNPLSSDKEVLRTRCPCLSCHGGGEGSIATLTLNLITRWRWVVSFAPLSHWQEEVYSIFCSSYLNSSASVKGSIFWFNFKPTKTKQCLATVN